MNKPQKGLFPFYLITIDDDDETTGIEYNSVVDYPAHMRAFEMYGKKKKRQYFIDEEQRMITGVVIAEGTPIFRDDQQLGKHYVVFTAPEIKKMWLRFKRNQFNNRVNKQHNLEDIVKPGAKGIYMVNDWFVDEEKGGGVPKSLRNQGIRPGSLIATYKIEDPKLWADMKSGKYNGFSIEGMFIKYSVDVKKISGSENAIERHNMVRKIIKKLIR